MRRWNETRDLGFFVKRREGSKRAKKVGDAASLVSIRRQLRMAEAAGMERTARELRLELQLRGKRVPRATKRTQQCKSTN